MAGHVLTFECRTLLVDLRLGAHDDARDAEATLQTTARRKGRGELLPFDGCDTFKRRYRFAGDLLQTRLARHHGLAVDQHGAATALPGRRTAVLRRRDVEFFAQCRQQVGVRLAHLDRGAVHDELGHLYILSNRGSVTS